MSILNHLTELRRRAFFSILVIAIGCIISYIGYPFILTIIQVPLRSIPDVSTNQLVIHSLYEGFIIRFKFALIGGLIFSIPVLLYQFMKFISPGLTIKERFFVITLLFFSGLFSVLGVALVYLYILPTSISFLLNSHYVPNGIGIMLNFQQNIFYVTRMLFYSSLLFQLPLVLFLTLYFNILSRNMLWKYSRYVVLVIVIVTAIFTPPDIVSQLGLAIPLLMSFFGVLGIAKIFRLGE